MMFIINKFYILRLVMFKKIILMFIMIPTLVYANQSLENDLKLASIGNSGAAFRLGSRYLNGEGVEKDYEKAKYWLEIAAEKNHSHALYDLGYIYLYGIGVEKDYLMAYDLFERAKDVGFIPAYFIIGLMYYDGAGVKKNDKKAYEYCKTAIERGYKTSNVILDHKNKKIIIKEEK